MAQEAVHFKRGREMKTKNLLIEAFVIGVLLLSGVQGVFADSVTDISKQLICSCGCGMVVNDCYCDLAKEWRTRIDGMLSEGLLRSDIISVFVDEYGDGVLATPAKSGLELVIWLAPVAVSVVGTVVIYRYAKNKAPIPTREIGYPIRERTAEESEIDSSEPDVEDDYEELFYEEYRKYKKKE
jgi:cytochrome c-type biogenesis protein CcmH/NrfF